MHILNNLNILLFYVYKSFHDVRLVRKYYGKL